MMSAQEFGQYRPSVAVGPHNVLYYAGTSQSSDINTVVGSEFQDLLSTYHTGGVDGFLAKFIDTADGSEYNCRLLRNFRNDQPTFGNLAEGQLRYIPILLPEILRFKPETEAMNLEN